jgi:hypothetical protein
MKDDIDTIIRTVNWKVGQFSFLPIVFGILMSFFDISMMSLAKLSSKGKLSYGHALSAATVLYSIEPYIFFKSLNYESMTAMNLIWDLTSDVMVTLVGVFYFGESIKGIRWIAVLFAFFSLALFAYTD